MSAQRFWAVFSLLFMISMPVWAIESKSISWPNEKEEGTYEAKIASTGKKLWTVHWQTRTVADQDKVRVEIQEQGEGQPLAYKEPITWQKKMVFLAPGTIEAPELGGSANLEVESLEGSRWTAKGGLLSTIDMRLDPIRQRFTYLENEAGEKLKPATVNIVPRILPDELLFHWARMLPFEQAAKEGVSTTEYTLLVNPKRQFKMVAKVKGREIVTTPAGTFDCYRVELAPKLPKPMQAMAPKMSLWCNAQAPHHWVRYQGPVGGPGSPQAVIELVKFSQQAAQE